MSEISKEDKRLESYSFNRNGYRSRVMEGLPLCSQVARAQFFQTMFGPWVMKQH